MDVKEQKELIRKLVKSIVPMEHSERIAALDFADKYIEAVEAFDKLSPGVKRQLTRAFTGVAISRFDSMSNPCFNGF